MKSNTTRLFIIVAFLFSSMFAIATNLNFNSNINTEHKSPGNNLFLSIPSDGIPAVVNMCNALTYKVNVSNLQTADQNNVTLDVKFPLGIVPEASGITVNGSPATFTTPNAALPNEVLVTIGTILANPGNAEVVISAKATCVYFDYASQGGSSRIFYRANYPGNTDLLNVIGNPVGFTNEFNPSLPALNVLNVTPQSPSVTLNSVVTRTINLVNGGSGGLNTFDVFDDHGTTFTITNIIGATVISNTATQLKLRVDAAQIAANAGNDDGDGILELNETYAITLEYTVTNCNLASAGSVVRAAWGCEVDQYCDDSVFNGGVSFGNIVPNITVIADTANPLYENPKCFGAPYHRVVKLTNIGTGISTDGTFKVSCTYPGYNTEYNPTWMLNRMVPGSVTIRINGGAATPATILNSFPPTFYDTSGPGASYDGKYLACFGPLSGSINAYEISIPNLNPTDVLTIEYDVETCANTICYAEDYTGNQMYTLKYKDACASFNYIAAGSINNNVNYNPNLSVNVSGPSDVNGYPVGAEDTASYNFEITNYDNAYFIYPGAKYHLEFAWTGTGLIPNSTILDPANFNINGNVPLPGFPVVSGNSVIVEYAYPFATSPIGDKVTIDLKATCGTGGTSTVGVTGYFSADGSCPTAANGNSIRGLCTVVPFPTVIHCGTGCADGLAATKAEGFRTNIGLEDANNDRIADSTNPATGTSVRKDRVTIGDNLTIKTTGNIINTTPSIVFNQLEGVITFPVPATPTTGIQAVDGKVTVTRAGVPTVTTGLPVTQAGAAVTFAYTAAALNVPGGTFIAGDIVNFELNVINNENSGAFQIANRTVSTNIYVTTAPAGTPYACDNYSAVYQNVGFNEFSYSQVNRSLINGCAEDFYEIQITGKRFGTDWNTDPFPNEVRPAYLPYQTTYRIPTGYELDVALSYTTFYNNIPSLSSFTNVSLNPSNYSIAGNIVTVDLYKAFTVNGGSLPTPDMQILSYTYLYFKPTCLVTNAVAQNFGTRTSYDYLSPQQEAYATLGGMKDPVSGRDYGPYPVATYPVGTFYTDTAVTFAAPTVNLTTPVAVQDAPDKFVSWTVNLSNPSTSGAGNTWFSLDNTLSAGLTILDVTEGATVFTANPVNNLYELGTLAGGATRSFTIRAIYADCAVSSLRVFAGWNCPRYPTSLAAYPCVPKVLTLSNNPLPGEIQANVISQPTFPAQFCDTYTFKNRVTNTKLAYLWDHTARIRLSAGYALVPGSVIVEFPEGSGTTYTIDAANITQVGTTYTVNVSAAIPALSRTGVGLAPVSIPASNKYTLQYQVQSFCPTAPEFFTAGKQLYFQPTAKTWCGKNVNKPLIVTNPYTIQGAPLPYNMAATLTSPIVNACAPNETELVVKLVNLGNPPAGPNNATSSSDFINVTLPPGFSYVASSITSVSNFGTTNPTVTTNSNGEAVLEWAMTNGVPQNGVIEYKFRVTGSSAVVCDDVALFGLETSAASTVTCSTNGLPCAIRNLTSQVNSEIQVVKPIPTITAASGGYLVGAPNFYSADVSVTNTGIVPTDLTTPVVVKFYCADASNNPTGAVLYTGTFSSVIAPGATSTQMFNFSASGCADGTKLVGVIDLASNCSCAPSQFLINFNSLIVANDDSGFAVQNGTAGNSNVGSIFNNNSFGSDTLNGVPTSPAAVSISIITPATPALPGALVPVLDTTTGIISVPAGTPAGTYSIVYKICETAVPTNCDEATIIVRVEEDIDNDGVLSTADLDDDNDGILDTVEGGPLCYQGGPTVSINTPTPNLPFNDTINTTTTESPIVLNGFANGLFNVTASLVGGATWNADGLNGTDVTGGVQIENNFPAIGDYIYFQPITTTNAGAYAQYEIDFASPVVDFRMIPAGLNGNDTYEIYAFNGAAIVPVTTSNVSNLDLGNAQIWTVNNIGNGVFVNQSINFGGTNVTENTFTFNLAQPITKILIRSYKNATDATLSPVTTGITSFGFCSPTPYRDTDNDGISDYEDLDSDNDGITDLVEAGNPAMITADTDGNGILSPSELVGTPVGADGIPLAAQGTEGTNPIAPVSTDGDGLPNYLDLDSDNDGITDLTESGNANAAIADTNNDGTISPTEGASGSNGIPNPAETGGVEGAGTIPPRSTDGDGFPNYIDLDSDNDGITDLVESGNTNAITADTDGNGTLSTAESPAGLNGIPNAAELGGTEGAGVTDPRASDGDSFPNYIDLDSDNDGITDLVESGNTAAITADADNNGTISTTENPAGTDGIPNVAQGNTDNSTVVAPASSDADGFANYVDIDSDNDGIIDNIEAQGDNPYVAPSNVDADNNGVDDAYEVGVAAGLIPENNDTDAFPNHLDIDADNDGIIDNIEGQSTFGYLSPGPDTDGNGLADVYETAPGSGVPTNLPQNSDGTDNPDYLDLDTDNDGATDYIEAYDTNADNIADTPNSGVDADNDGLIDSFDDSIFGTNGLADPVGPTNNNQDVLDLPNDQDPNTAQVDFRDDVVFSVPVDTDADGFNNNNDIDDDNDGIVDYVESLGFQPSATLGDPCGLPPVSFTTNALETGTAGSVGAVYRFQNVATYPGFGLIDALVEITAITGGATLITIDDNGGTGNINAWQPHYNVPLPTGNVADMAFKVTYVLDGTSTQFNIGRLGGVIYDIDGQNAAETVILSSPGLYAVDGATELTVTPNLALGTVTFDQTVPLTYTGVDLRPENAVYFNYYNSSVFNVRFSAELLAATANTNFGSILFDICGINGLFSPANSGSNPVFTVSDGIDSDGDGISDEKDIDADNDGIVDNIEGQTTVGYGSPGSFVDTDGDGLIDAYDNAASTGLSPVDLDNDNIPDYLDLDTDGDNVPDNIEAWDTNNNGIIDGAEFVYTTADADGDGLADVYDNNDALFNPNNGTSLTVGVQDPLSFPDVDNVGGDRDWRDALDNDNDGIADNVDPDDDNDGILDTAENVGNPTGDDDNDGILNYQDTTPLNDLNGDGIVDTFDTDGDGTINQFDLDSDNDGTSDVAEAGGSDPDNDGIIGNGPFTDGDGDGLADLVEVTPLLNEDSDFDGTPDSVDLDSDNDGIADIVEDGNGALDPDSDGTIDGTDTDGDGILDTYDGDNDPATPEVTTGLDTTPGPGGSNLGLTDTDGDGTPNQDDLDADNDGINDLTEAGVDATLDGNSDGVIDAPADLDNDGILDAADANTGSFGDPNPADSPGNFDNDGIPNYLDLDADNDGLSDVIETGNGALDTDNNGVIDGVDGDGDGILDTVDVSNTPDPTGGSFGDADTTDSPLNTDDLTDGAGNSPNYLDIDADNDGIPDNIEGQPTVGYNDPSPTFTDLNNNGLDDGYEGIGNYITTPTNTDGSLPNADTTPDYLDADSDNDGLTDISENNEDVGLPSGVDADNDGLDDAWDDVITAPGAPADVNDNINTPDDVTLDDEDNDYNPGTGDVDYRDIFDNDNDGVADNTDPDDDNDGILDTAELGGVDPYADADGDGIQNLVDPDFTGLPDADGDGTPDYQDLDSDNDGTSDVAEAGGSDPDNDGIIGNGPFTDGDGDGLADLVEVTPLLNEDSDFDGTPDSVDLDSDNDGIADIVEDGNGALDPDSDGTIDGTDTDGDGILDTYDGDNDPATPEVTTGLDTIPGPGGTGLGLTDTDGDGTPNQDDLDADNDGINDLTEAGVDAALDGNSDGVIDAPADLDNDGILDAADANTGSFGDPNPADSPGNFDNDGIPNYLDLDADNDGLSDVIETGNGALDTDNNGVIDGVDGDGDGILDTVDVSNTPDPTGGSFGDADTTDSPLNTDDLTDGAGNSPNYLDIDADNDGIPDNIEGQPTVGYNDPSPTFTDLNNNGLDDGYEGAGYIVTPTNTDGTFVGGDATPDYLDPDSDNDGLTDISENNEDVGLPSGVDADNDGLDDAWDDVITAPGAPADVNDNINTPDDVTLDDEDNDYNPGTGDVDYRDIFDNDNDGVADNTDPDDDNDGILDTAELGGVDPYADADGDGIQNLVDPDFTGLPDADGDGTPDYQDLDSDNDGTSDVAEAGGSDPDNDGIIGNGPFTDGDGDGLADLVEVTPLLNEDSDFDGTPDSVDLDSDNDGIADIVEDGNGALDPDSDGTIDGTDTDGDGILDTYDGDNDPATPEVTTGLDTIPGPGGTGLGLTDTDGDGTPNQDDLDADNDGINDLTEAGVDAALDGNSDGVIDAPADLDNDGILDAADANTGSFGDPNPADSPGNFDNDGIPNYLDLDADNDGISDLVETGGTDTNGDGVVNGPDTDGDGILDTVDVSNTPDPTGGSFGDADTTDSPLNTDDLTDGAGNSPNYLDIDADNDGIPDNIEGQPTAGYDAPSGVDVDGDGLDDAYDGDNGLTVGTVDEINPDLVPTNTDGSLPNADTTPDYLDADSDNDGLTDISENNEDVGLPSGVDADNDGLDDAWDAVITAPGAPADVNDNINTPDDVTLGDEDNDYNPGTGDVDYRDIFDNDNDGVADNTDPDDDNDGILDTAELGGVDPYADADGDGIQNLVDPDFTGLPDADGDGTPDYQDLDSDNDGTSDVAEAGGSDPDNDGIIGNGPFTDGDGDGLADLVEVTPLLNEDSDFDGTPDSVDLDSDNDGIADIVEDGNGALDPDSDGTIDGTDTDGDGILDTYDGDNDPATPEVTTGLDTIPGPGGTGLGLTDTDGDGTPNQDDLDADNDGINDLTEAGVDAALDGNSDGVIDAPADLDNDGILDAADANTGSFGDPNPADSPGNFDNDGIPNYLDLDADNDGLSDVIETGNGALDTDNNGVIDGVDGDGDGILDTVDVSNTPDPTGGSFGDADTTDSPLNTDDLTDGAGNSPNYLDIDADNDGIPDNIEGQPTVGYNDPSPTFTDLNNNGLDDGYEGAGYIVTPTNTDGTFVGGDAIPDYLDPDSDNDGVADAIEAWDINNDGVADQSPTGVDVDNDGLDDGYDSVITPVGSPIDVNDNEDGGSVDTNNSDGVTPTTIDDVDYRDIDDDNDGVNTQYELDPSGNGGAPDDSDGDFIPDYLDVDDDGDGVDTEFENPNPDGDGNPTTGGTQDSDNDGIDDYLDIDDDGDGVDTEFENPNPDGDGNPTTGGTQDFDGDGIDDYLDVDDDNDGLDTADENPDPNNNGDPADAQNTDGDSNPDYLDIDDDNDGIATADEDLDGDGDPRNDDTDGDGVPNYLDIDDDNDGILSLNETSADLDNDGNPNYLDQDADGDGIPDNVEGQPSVGYEAPSGVDANGNGLDDAYDDLTGAAGYGSGNGIQPENTDGSDTPDYLDVDSDNDGIHDVYESGIELTGADSDADGLDNAVDTETGWGDPNGNVITPAGLNTLQDTDGDALTNGSTSDFDYRDIDDDNDGLDTADEFGDGNGDGNPDDAFDSDGDGIPDYLEQNNNNGTSDLEVFQLVTPNNDGENDVFVIKNIERYPTNTVEIYNRWGVLVYEVNGYNPSQGRAFKGISEGRVTISQSSELPTGTYFYVIKYVDPTSGASNDKAGYLYINR